MSEIKKIDFFLKVDNFKRNNNIDSKLIYGDLSTRKDTKFTIAIPTYLRPDTFLETFESAINQIGDIDYEIVIVDNSNETSELLEIIRKYSSSKVFYFKNEQNLGMLGNWNRCIELAKGDYITILHDDDILSVDYLESCENYLDKKTDGIIFKNFVFRGKKIDIKEFQKKPKNIFKIFIKFLAKEKKKLTLFDFFLGNQSYGTLGILFKTKKLIELGGYNSDYFPSSDYVLHANYCENFNLYLVNKRLNYYRIHNNESLKQETLGKWEHIDYEIRKFLTQYIRFNRKILMNINEILKTNQMYTLENSWGYNRNVKTKLKLKNKIILKFKTIKNILNF